MKFFLAVLGFLVGFFVGMFTSEFTPLKRAAVLWWWLAIAWVGAAIGWYLGVLRERRRRRLARESP